MWEAIEGFELRGHVGFIKEMFGTPEVEMCKIPNSLEVEKATLTSKFPAGYTWWRQLFSNEA